jgi:hypothetical protein
MEQIRSIPVPLAQVSDEEASMGLVNGGLALVSTCWNNVKMDWMVDPDSTALRECAPGQPRPVLHFDHTDRAPKNILERHPVDILLWDHSSEDPAKVLDRGDPLVTTWLKRCDAARRPSLIVELWGASAAMHANGPLSKPVRKVFRSQGYSQRSFHAADTALGGAVSQERLLVVYFNDMRLPEDVVQSWDPPDPSLHPARPMSNLLKPHSIPRLAYHNVRRHRPLNAMRRIPNSVTDPMPASVGAWIDTPLGIRKLLPEELAKGLGVPSGWMLPSKEIPGRFLNNLVGTHIWEALGTSLVPVLQQRSSLRGASNKLPTPPPSGIYGGVRRDDTKLKTREAPPVSPSKATPTTSSKMGTVQDTYPSRQPFSSRPAAVSDGRPPDVAQMLRPLAPVSDSHQVPIEEMTSTSSPDKKEHSCSPSVDEHPRSPARSDAPTEISDAHETNTVFDSVPGVWQWEPPDISQGSPWHMDRVYNLLDACKGLKESLRHFDEGLLALDRHRQNYGGKITYLQILWWEFPCERWSELRDGCSMNFLVEPEHNSAPNSPMDEVQTQVAAEFVDELIGLGILRKPTPDQPVLAKGPMFCLEKPGQPGQWRILANFKAGKQNEAVGKDPVFLNRVDTVLPLLYSGGYSAVIDASKFFYQFPTRPEDQPYLGVTHPVTLEDLYYGGLPMGGANCPAVAGRMGAAFMRLVRTRRPDLFQGTGSSNTWRDGFLYKGFDPKLGHGFTWKADDGLPAVLMWVHVDDFMIHGPTWGKTAAALTAVMDLALEVGLLFNPKKVIPPAQRVKYCGFIYDTTGIPTVEVPLDKRDRALAMLDYIRARSGEEMSRLSLSVVYGVLQSLVDATPSRLGQTFLRRAYNALYDGVPPDQPLEHFHYSMVRLSAAAWKDLDWWHHVLKTGLRRPVRYEHAATLAPTWGDGSGTGTGGTTHLHGSSDSPAMWMGQWAPHVTSESSNWRELRTLLLTLEIEVKSESSRFRGATVFYFTDNSTTYYVVNGGSSTSSGLQALIYRIKLAELALGCLLEAVHVPGRVMIVQGTDGLSRGVWVSSLHSGIDPTGTNADVFAPVEFSRTHIPWVLEAASLPPSTPIVWQPWDGSWASSKFLHRVTLWCPPPEIARQFIAHVILLWTESPHDTSVLFLIPRILQRQWSSLSRHIVEVKVIQPPLLPWRPDSVLPIPVVLLHLPTYVRSLPSIPDRLDRPTPPPDAEWHREQADFLRGLSAADYSP